MRFARVSQTLRKSRYDRKSDGIFTDKAISVEHYERNGKLSMPRSRGAGHYQGATFLDVLCEHCKMMKNVDVHATLS